MLHGFPTIEDQMEDLFNHPFYTFFQYLKLLRFLHIGDVKGSFEHVKDILSEIFIVHRYMFENLLTWNMAGFQLILSMHIFACGWVKIYTTKKHLGWVSVTMQDDSLA